MHATPSFSEARRKGWVCLIVFVSFLFVCLFFVVFFVGVLLTNIYYYILSFKEIYDILFIEHWLLYCCRSYTRYYWGTNMVPRAGPTVSGVSNFSLLHDLHGMLSFLHLLSTHIIHDIMKWMGYYQSSSVIFSLGCCINPFHLIYLNKSYVCRSMFCSIYF